MSLDHSTITATSVTMCTTFGVGIIEKNQTQRPFYKHMKYSQQPKGSKYSNMLPRYLSHSDFFKRQVSHNYCTFVKNVSNFLIYSHWFDYILFGKYLKPQSAFAKVWVDSKASALQPDKRDRSWKDGAKIHV